MKGATVEDKVRAILDRLYADDERQRQAGLPTDQRTRNLTRASGEDLSLLALATNAQRVLEIGSSNGVSTIWFALAMQRTGGFVTGTEILPERAADANANLAEAGLSTRAKVLAGNAGELTGTLAGPFDLVFIDAEKEDYAGHFERVFPLVRVGGVVIADNVLSHDISDYQRLVRQREDCETVTIPLDRGLEFTVRTR
jgi:predicted O-methyltransferase YrrM